MISLLLGKVREQETDQKRVVVVVFKQSSGISREELNWLDQQLLWCQVMKSSKCQNAGSHLMCEDWSLDDWDTLGVMLKNPTNKCHDDAQINY